MKRRRFWPLVIFCLCLCLSGCKAPIKTANLQDRAIVQGVGIDWEDGEYVITMQIFSPDGPGGQTIIDPSKENAKEIVCRGPSITEAVHKSAQYQGKEFYLGHNRIVVLGSEAAKQPLQGLLSYFMNGQSARPDVTMLVTPGKASDILAASVSQTILPAMSIEKTVLNAEQNGLVENIYLIDVLTALANQHRSAIIPTIEAVENEDEKNDLMALQLTGMAVFSQDRYVGDLSGEEVRGLLFLRNKMDGASYTMSNAFFERAVVQLCGSKTKIVPNIEGDKVKFQVTVECLGALTEDSLQPGKELSEDALKQLEKEMAGQIEKECRAAFEKAVLEYQSDIFYFGDMVWRDQPRLWETLKKDWPRRPADIQFSCEVSVTIERTGLEQVARHPG